MNGPQSKHAISHIHRYLAKLDYKHGVYRPKPMLAKTVTASVDLTTSMNSTKTEQADLQASIANTRKHYKTQAISSQETTSLGTILRAASQCQLLDTQTTHEVGIALRTKSASYNKDV